MAHSCTRSQSLLASLASKRGPILAMLAAATAALADPPRPVALTGTDGAYGPQLGAGVTFANFFTPDLLQAAPALNASGQAAFLGRLSGPGIGTSNDTGAWVYAGSGLRLVARTGDQAPDCDTTEVFASFYTEPAIDADGHVAFKAVLTGPGVDMPHNDGLWTEGSSGALHLLIRENVTAVPGGGGVFGFTPDCQYPDGPMWGNNPLVMNAGAVAQRCFITPGINPSGTFGVWTDRSGTLDFFIRADYSQPVPDQPGYLVIGVGNPAMNAAHALVASTLQRSAEGDRWGAWTDRSGTLTELLGTGDPIPGMPGAVLRSIDAVEINNQGRVALLIAYESIVPYPAILSEARFGALQLITKHGNGAPGTGGASYAALEAPVISENGVTAFRGRLFHISPVNDSNDLGLWSDRGGTLALVARSGNPAPDLTGVTYTGLYAPVINATGELAFIATLSDGIGLFRQGTDGVVHLVVRDWQTFDVLGDGSDLRLVTSIATLTTSGNPQWSASTHDGKRTYFNDDGNLVFRLMFADGSEGIFTTAPQLLNPGDLNCDGVIDNFDINPFVLALTSPSAYHAAYPNCNILNADCNNDGVVDNFDINPFVALLVGG